jgi:hypothetical protein
MLTAPPRPANFDPTFPAAPLIFDILDCFTGVVIGRKLVPAGAIGPMPAAPCALDALRFFNSVSTAFEYAFASSLPSFGARG